MDGLHLHVLRVREVLNYAALVTADDLPRRGATPEELFADMSGRSHALSVVLDLVVPRDVASRQAAIAQQLDDQIARVRRRLRRRHVDAGLRSKSQSSP